MYQYLQTAIARLLKAKKTDNGKENENTKQNPVAGVFFELDSSY